MAGVQGVAAGAMAAGAVQAAPSPAVGAGNGASSAEPAAASVHDLGANPMSGQFTAFSHRSGGSSRPDMLMALVLALLISQADNKRQQNDSMRLLAQLAILSALAPHLQQQGAGMTHQLNSLGAANQAYQTTGISAAAGSFNTMG